MSFSRGHESRSSRPPLSVDVAVYRTQFPPHIVELPESARKRTLIVSFPLSYPTTVITSRRIDVRRAMQ